MAVSATWEIDLEALGHASTADERRPVQAERRDTHGSRNPYQRVCETRRRVVGGTPAAAPATATDPAAGPTPAATTARPSPGTAALAAPISPIAPQPPCWQATAVGERGTKETGMERSSVTENAAERARLQGLAARLMDADTTLVTTDVVG
jgi:hypothetical protein